MAAPQVAVANGTHFNEQSLAGQAPPLAESVGRTLSPKRRRETVLGHLLLQALYARMYGDRPLPLAARGADGKPDFAGGCAHFSLSHSGPWVAVAIADCDPVGVDIEQPRPRRNWSGIAGHSFGPAEQAWLCRCEQPERAFYELWVLREAEIKRGGRGLTGLADVQIDPTVRTIRHAGAVPGACWLWHLNGCPLALCAAPAADEPALLVFTADGTFAAASAGPAERYIVVPV